MDHISGSMYVSMTVLLTAALLSVAFLKAEYMGQRRSIAWWFLLLGWASITLRFWWGVFDGDRTISYAGAIGLLLLAGGTVLEAMRR